MLEYSLVDSKRKINAALIYMNAHIHERFDLKSVSEAANTSEYYFIRVFKEIVGETPGRFFRKLKVDAIDRRLREDPEQNLTDLALSFGYSSSSVLTREFRTFIGHNPKTCKSHFQAQISNNMQIEGNI